MSNGNTGSTGSSFAPRDRTIVIVQLILGTSLVAFGALLLVIFKATNVLGTSTDVTAIAGNIATGVLGVGAALLPAGAAASASARILSGLPSQPSGQAPIITGVSATADPAGGPTKVTGQIVTSDDGFWFIQYGDASGNYSTTLTQGSVSGMPGGQNLSADVTGVPAGKYVRVGFKANSTGQTTYSQEVTVK
jgi:hypothetical protein